MIKKRPISKTKKISAVILRLQICNLWFSCDITPLYCWEIEVRLIFFTPKIFEKKIIRKIIKTPFLENQKDVSSHSWTPDLQLLNLPWQQSTKGWEIEVRSVFYLVFLYLSFFEKKNEKIIKNAISRKPKISRKKTNFSKDLSSHTWTPDLQSLNVLNSTPL